jgi:hypothetical protein
MLLSSIPSFSFSYDPQAGIIWARWMEPLDEQQLKETFLALLGAARAHEGCRFFLLDIRHRPVAGPAQLQWAQQVLHPQLSAALGEPVFLAFVIAPGQRPHIEHPNIDTYLRAATTTDIYPYYFETEEAALSWLRHQQELA